MIRYRSTLLLAVSFMTCLGWVLSVSRHFGLESAIAHSLINLPDSFLVAQSPSPSASEQPLLQRGSQGSDVSELQTKLKQLGYYEGAVDGVYGRTTEEAVSEFKKSVELEATGVAGPTTIKLLQTAVAQKSDNKAATPQPEANNSINQLKQQPWLLPSAAVAMAALGGGIMWLRKPRLKIKKAVKQRAQREQDNLPTETFQANGVSSETETLNPDYSTNGHNSSEVTVSLTSHPLDTPTRLSKIDIVDELIKDLRGPNPQKRRKAIWELAQQGDSRAVQPLVNLLIDADSKQRSLILEALSQIGTKTLTPLNRALAISLQDDNAEVRKNAIRDLTQIYEQVAQISQMLCHAADDPDPDVQETARWAMGHLSRIRTAAALDTLPPSRSSKLNLPSEQDKKPSKKGMINED